MSDETHFAVGQEAQQWVTRFYDERHEPDCQQYKSKNNPSTLHYWGAVGWNYKSKLILYWDEKGSGNLTMDMYIDCLMNSGFVQHVQEEKKAGVKVLLEEDGDSAHGHASKQNKVAIFKEEHGIDCYANCSYSPDFSIIENIWRNLKQRVKRHRCTTHDALKEAIQYEWSQISCEEINEKIMTMRQRIADCLDADGHGTKW